MQVFADLHIHSRYARGTSKDMNFKNLDKYSQLKGLNLVGTGDFTHPEWLSEIKVDLKEHASGIYKCGSEKVFYVLTAEVSNIYEQGGRTRKVHHVLIAPSFEVVAQINEFLKKFGNLESDGRPILKLASPDMLDGLSRISKDILIFSAHAWTPYFGVFGSKSGFDSLRDCYQDQLKNLHGIETGMSSDPAMNWRLSQLDNLAIISNSDCHSYWPWRLGREANVLEVPHLDYKHFSSALVSRDPEKFSLTVEVDPSYGKYHWDGHAAHNVSMSPDEAKKHNNTCPVCRKRMTIGVEHRVEDLADRPTGHKPKDAIPFKILLPLSELIAGVSGVGLTSKKVWDKTMKLIEVFGSEYNILLNAEKKKLEEEAGDKLAAAVLLNRDGRIKVKPGYDGVYGVPIFFDDGKIQSKISSPQKFLSDFET